MEIFDALDTNHDDEIHYNDFLAAMVSTRIAVHDDLLKQAFRKFDLDNTGYITVDNLKEVLGEHHEGEDVENLLKEADFTHDGRISYDEFVAFVKGENATEAHQEAAHKVIDGMVDKGHKNECDARAGLEKNRIEMKKSEDNKPSGGGAKPAGGGKAEEKK